jgi:hypothetical protein
MNLPAALLFHCCLRALRLADRRFCRVSLDAGSSLPSSAQSAPQ